MKLQALGGMGDASDVFMALERPLRKADVASNSVRVCATPRSRSLQEDL